ncbi:MAG: winged helix-turn-helix domain-containing protein, partial [Burkholderiales bacterium]
MRYLFENFALDPERRELRCQSAPLSVEPQVFDLLVFLIRNRDRVVSKDDIFAAVWRGRIVSESALSTRINAARAVLGDTGATQRFIKTLPRKGLRFVGAVVEDPEMAVPGPMAASFSEANKPSIAVLPFSNLSGDPAQDYFSDGMVEDITTA